MTFNLFAYELSGSTLGVDLSSWDDSDLSGNSPFMVSSATTVSGYTEITSIENWLKFGRDVLHDYQDYQKAIKLAGYDKGWTAMTNTEKDIIIDHYAHPQINPTGSTQNTQQVIHLMTTKGFSQEQATDYIVDVWWDHWTASLSDCDGRWRRAVKTTIQYLSFADASDLFEEIEILVGYYLESGRLGIGFGDSKDGMMNYIMSNEGYTGNGLEYNNYTLKKGTWDELKTNLCKDLVSDYFWGDLNTHIQTMY